MYCILSWLQMYMRHSWIKIEYYFIVYSDSITAFECCIAELLLMVDSHTAYVCTIYEFVYEPHP